MPRLMTCGLLLSRRGCCRGIWSSALIAGSIFDDSFDVWFSLEVVSPLKVKNQGVYYLLDSVHDKEYKSDSPDSRLAVSFKDE